MSRRRMGEFLILNAIVSCAVSLAVLLTWSYCCQTEMGRAPIPTPDATLAAIQMATNAALPQTPVPSPTPLIHVVRRNETMGIISNSYGITVEELMTANGLSDPNSLDVGQMLVIPALPTALPATSLPQETAAVGAGSTQAAPLAPATTSPLTDRPQLTIVGVTNVGAYEQEQVVLVNSGGTVSLAGWQLAGPDDAAYKFPGLRLNNKGRVAVHSAAGQDTVIDLYWARAGAVWQSGAQVRLIDAQGAVHATFAVP